MIFGEKALIEVFVLLIGNADESAVNQIKDALLDREDCNVILVDWSKGADLPYEQAAGNTRLVGAQIGELIRFLITGTNSHPNFASHFYIVGHSLGAHTAGYAGSYLKQVYRMSLGRITGK